MLAGRLGAGGTVVRRFAVRSRAPAVAAVDEDRLADSTLGAWLSPAEEAELRELLAGVTGPGMPEAARVWHADYRILLADAGERLEPWQVEESLRHVVAARRREACRVWAAAHGVSPSEAAHRFRLGWC